VGRHEREVRRSSRATMGARDCAESHRSAG
jgi:hypothetical protein